LLNFTYICIPFLLIYCLNFSSFKRQQKSILWLQSIKEYIVLYLLPWSLHVSVTQPSSRHIYKT
jgi:hypothetical protein